MNPSDAAKTAFVTDLGVFAYKKMPFGLKNVESTYQHLVDQVFQNQIRRNVEMYIDDIVIKSRRPSDFPHDLWETLESMWHVGCILNPDKCSFGVQAKKFLGYLVSHQGLGINPNKL